MASLNSGNHGLRSRSVVLDFDGTVTESDLLDRIALEFGDPAVYREVEDGLHDGRLPLREVIVREFVPVTAPLDEVVGWVLDEATVRDALVVVESRAAALAPPPAGSADLAGATVHAELGELVAGTRPGRRAPHALTLYKSVGVGLEDDAAAALALRGAEVRALGTVVEL